jgi:hypothetical protein
MPFGDDDAPVVPDATDQRRQVSRAVREIALAVGVVVAFVAVATWWTASPRDRVRSRVVDLLSSGREPDWPYIGARACRECHPSEAASHAGSGHARTLRAAAGIPLARRLDGRTVADPERPDVTWTYALRGGDLVAERRAPGGIESYVLEFAFGSGQHATTFVSLKDSAAPTALEHRLTHYTSGDTLAITPGQRAAAPLPGTTPHGRDQTPAETLKCFGCHSTRVSTSAGFPDLSCLIPSVSCERCHGSARNHVVQARAGRTDLRMPFGPGSWTSEAQLALCGQCHRHPSRAVPGIIHADNPALARFQPVGLSESKCYSASDGALSCVNCHDPHARASTTRPSYEAACLRCHEGPRRTACPVSPRAGCIDCHMPKVDAGQRVLYTDHWIRVRKTNGTPPPS